MQVIDARNTHYIMSLLKTPIVENNIIAKTVLEQVLYDIQHIPTIDVVMSEEYEKLKLENEKLKAENKYLKEVHLYGHYF